METFGFMRVCFLLQVLGTPTPTGWKNLPHLPCYHDHSKCFQKSYPSLSFREIAPRIEKIEFGIEFAIDLLKV